ncbi:hypothetical protein [Escherichia albertii]|uniref:hypothetical protein n=1 Tax=Escherichia albertii TaxID=208962 RepID=UPI0014853422|nr:hypothetical protein [Escherichia albertii]
MFISTAAKAEAERAISAGKTVSRTEKIFMKKARLRIERRPYGNWFVKHKKTKWRKMLIYWGNCSRNSKKSSTFEEIMITIPIYNKGVTMIMLNEAL